MLFIPLFGFAQNGSTGSPQGQAALPKAGLTPESPFYFFDKLGETLQTFFTFNPEGKARLQITFAAERVAEIKIILETKGIEAKGLEVAQSRLQAHLANVATIVTEQKSKGKDVATLAKELDDKLETPKSVLADSFKAEERNLEIKEDELKTQLKVAHKAGDTAKEEELAQELGQVKAQLELLELKEEDIEDELEAEEEKLEEELETQHKAEKAIREAEEEKQEVLDEASEEGVELPTTAFAKFDQLLTQAKELFAKENFQGAKQLAEQAEDALEDIEEDIEKLEEEKEQKEEQMKEEEEQQKEETEEAEEDEEQAKEKKQKQEEKQQKKAKDKDQENEDNEEEER